MRQVPHRETRQQGLSQDPLKLDLYRRCKVPVSACLSWFILLIWAEPVTNPTFWAGCAQGQPFVFSSWSQCVSVHCPWELLQAGSVGATLVCSKILELRDSEGLLRVFFANQFTKVPEITWSAGWDESNFWDWGFLCSADKINSTYLSLLLYTDVACYKVHLSQPFFLIYFLQCMCSWHGKFNGQTGKLMVSVLRSVKAQIRSKYKICSVQILSCRSKTCESHWFPASSGSVGQPGSPKTWIVER